MHRSHGLQGSLKRRYKHPSPTSINGYHTAKKLLSQSPAKRPTFAFADESGYTLAFANRIAHSGLHAETGAVSDGGAITTLGAFCAVRKPCVARCQNGVLCRFGILAGRCSRRTQKTFGTAMRLCVSLSRRRRGPAGLRDLFRFCRNCGLYALFQILLSVLQTLQLVPFLCKLRLSSFLFGSEFNGFRSKQAGFFAIILENV